jgi:hypothetical protein
MAQVVVPKAGNVRPVGQADVMQCWLASYTMLLRQNDPSLTVADVEAKLKAGGFAEVDVCKGIGLDDSDLPRTAQALDTGTMFPGCILTLSLLQGKLNNFGALWMGLHLKSPIDGNRYRHVIVALGVDQDAEKVYAINPWMYNPTDFPVKAWVEWKWIREGINNSDPGQLHGSEGVYAGIQYLKP